MANEENLRNIADLPPEERKAFASAGGKASAEAKRKRKAMKEQFEILLSLPVTGSKTKASLKGLGVEPEDMDNQMAIMAAMIKQAMSGNVKAFTAIRDTVEMDAYREETLELKKKELELKEKRLESEVF